MVDEDMVDESKCRELNAFTAKDFEIRLHPVYLDVLERHYKRTDNPLYAWKAIQAAHELNLALPEWVLTYIKKSADQLLDIPGGLRDKLQAAIAEALGLKTDGGGSQITRFRDEQRNFQICTRVQDLREQHDKRKDDEIYRQF